MVRNPQSWRRLAGVVATLAVSGKAFAGDAARSGSADAVAEAAKNAPAAADPAGPDVPLPNLETVTLGGLQFWHDEFVHYDWRVQRNAQTGHCRLLDDRDVRLAWGTFDECRREFERQRVERKLPPLPRRKVVVLLHGLGRTRYSMRALGQYLAKHGGYTPIYVGYASTQAPLETHARALARVLEPWDEVEEIDFVAHSLGNLVIRRWWHDRLGGPSTASAERGAGEDPLASGDAAAARSGPRVRRLVMLGPPNQGADRAVWWATNQFTGPTFRWIVGPAAAQLGPSFADVRPTLATPDCEFGILAGGLGDGQGWNPGLEGDDDGTVRVEETRLAGAHDFQLVPLGHNVLIAHETAFAATLRFLDQGHFVSDAARQPLPR